MLFSVSFLDLQHRKMQLSCFVLRVLGSLIVSLADGILKYRYREGYDSTICIINNQ